MVAATLPHPDHGLHAPRLRAPARGLDGARRDRRHRPEVAVEAGAGPDADRAAERVRHPHRRRGAARSLRDRRRARRRRPARARRLPRQPQAAGQAGAGRAADDQRVRPAPADLPAPGARSPRRALACVGLAHRRRSGRRLQLPLDVRRLSRRRPGLERDDAVRRDHGDRRASLYGIAQARCVRDPGRRCQRRRSESRIRVAALRRWLASLGNLGRLAASTKSRVRHSRRSRHSAARQRRGYCRGREAMERARPPRRLSECVAGGP